MASRAMLNTGLSLWRASRLQPKRKSRKSRQSGEPPNGMAALVQQGRLWSQLMKGAGYETYFAGKWHVKAKAEAIFDHVGHVRPGMPKQTSAGYNRPKDGEPDTWSPYDTKFGGFWQGGKHWSEVLADEGVAFLEQARTRRQPFFMYLAFNAPHDPRQSPKEYVDMYPLESMKLPANFLPEYPFNEEMESGRKLRDERLAPFPRTAHAVKVHRQEYYAIISHMDAQIGRILQALEKTGKAENTYVFFTSDHGLAVGQHGLFGKQNLYDHSVRVPLLVIGPGIPKGARIAAPVYLQDIMATCLELARVQSDHVEFKSLLPLIRGERAANYDVIYGAYKHAQRMITKDGYKLILYPRAGKIRLYHVAEDPWEMNDLADRPDMRPVVKQLFAALRKKQEELDDSLDLSAAFQELFP